MPRYVNAAVLAAARADLAAERAAADCSHRSNLSPLPLHSASSTGYGPHGSTKRERDMVERLAIQAAMPPLPPPAIAGSECAWRQNEWRVDERGRAVYSGCWLAAHVQPEGVPLCMDHWRLLAQQTLERSNAVWDDSADRTMRNLLVMRTSSATPVCTASATATLKDLSSSSTQPQPCHVCHARYCHETVSLTSAFHGLFCVPHLQWLYDLRCDINVAKMHGEVEEEIRLRQAEAMGRRYFDKRHVDFINERLHVLLNSPSVMSPSVGPSALASRDSSHSSNVTSPSRSILNAAARPFVPSSPTSPTVVHAPYSPSSSSASSCVLSRSSSSASSHSSTVALSPSHHLSCPPTLQVRQDSGTSGAEPSRLQSAPARHSYPFPSSPTSSPHYPLPHLVLHLLMRCLM